MILAFFMASYLHLAVCPHGMLETVFWANEKTPPTLDLLGVINSTIFIKWFRLFVFFSFLDIV